MLNPGVWALRALTPDFPDDSPWRLVVSDPDKPGFLQTPKLAGLNWQDVATPDELDMLITARNHDVKQAVARHAESEDWVYALVSLQTCEGYSGPKNYGIARMNAGSSSRAMLGLAPVVNGSTAIHSSIWWKRDVRRLLKSRAEKPNQNLGTVGGPALIWCFDWLEGDQFSLNNLDPWFIEICRRVRLMEKNGKILAIRAPSKSSRVDAKAFKGNTRDPWAPIHRKEEKSLTLGENRDFSYRRLYDLLFSGEWEQPLLASPDQDERDNLVLIAEAFARGNCVTGGFKSRVIPVPGKMAHFLSSDPMARIAKAQMEEISKFERALRFSLALMAAGGEKHVLGETSRDKNKKERCFARADYACRQFDNAADDYYFPSLWRRTEAAIESGEAGEQAKLNFLIELKKAAQKELVMALPAIPCAATLRPRAEARAQRAFNAQVRKHFPEIFLDEEKADAA